MVIKWLGHSCFKITLEDGTRILLDPFSKTVGYTPQDVEADIVTISHAHNDHSDLSHVTGNYKVVNTPGVHTFGDVTIEGITTWHDHSMGAHRGTTIIYVLTVDGIRVCHMGDTGCVPSDDVMAKLAGTKILMIPVGGRYTIDATEALAVCERIAPNIIIPMHFKTPATNLDIAPLLDFLEAAGREYDVSHHGQCYLTIDKDSLKKRTRIVVMEYL